MSNKVHERSIEMEEEEEEEEGSLKTKRKYVEVRKKIKKIVKNIWNVGKEDPRRVKHSLKVGVALTLVSLLYLLEPLFKGIGSNAMWAVMTVVVVLEFSAGATLCKGLNRGLGTLIAGSLAFFIEYVANCSGKVFRAFFIGTAVFIIGATITYLRFIPYIKKNYDYGMLIFLLTFNLITVSSYRVDTVIKIAHERFYTIAIGVGICLLMTILVFPIWSGEDLHKTTVSKLQGLSRCIQACVSEYFEEKEKDNETLDQDSSDDTIYKGYKCVLDSKSTDEALALYSSWEPRHTRHCHKFPWQHYVKVGAVLRQFGYTVVALHGCLKTEIQTPRSIRVLYKDPCVRLAGEVCKVLSELAESIRKRRHCSPEILSDSLQLALRDLNTAFKSQPKLFLGCKLNGNVSQRSDNLVSQRIDSGRHNLDDTVLNSPYIGSKENDIVSHIGQNTGTQRNDAVSYIGQNTGTQRNDAVSRNEQNTGTHRNDGVSHIGQNNGTQRNDGVLGPGQNDGVSLSSLRSDTLDRRSVINGERKILRSQLSKISVMSRLEFWEALPFAAFASLLVEMVARLDNVIEEVEELGRIACFKEYDNSVDRTAVKVRVEKPTNLVVGVE